MNVLIIETPSFGLDDAKESFTRLGHKIISFKDENIYERKSEAFVEKFRNAVNKNNIDIVFSINYYPIVSMCCKELWSMENRVKYISIVYDNPHIGLYHYSLINSCNFVFIFDYSMYDELKSGGVNTVYYLPLPVNTDRYDRILKKSEKYANDISFVGHFYNESHNLYDRLISGLENVKDGKYVKGYLDGVVEMQSRVDGYFFAEEMLNDEVLKVMKEAYPYEPAKDSIATEKYVYGSYFLGRKSTEIARIRLLKVLSEELPVSIYTPGIIKELPGAVNKGSIDWYNETPQVFYNSKININITLKSIKTGIPFRVLDIMAAKGFVITNYQEDLFRHFEPDIDFVYYNEEKDLVNKAKYYLEHEDERNTIALNGYNKVKKMCNYADVLREILEGVQE